MSIIWKIATVDTEIFERLRTFHHPIINSVFKMGQ